MTGKFEIVQVDDLLTHYTVGTQRIEGVQANRVAEMVTAWDMSKVGTITVSRRKDGTLFVPDGAHRVTAARELGIEKLPAIVHSGLTREEEAALFVGLNTFAQPSAISRFLARVDQGEPLANDIKRIIEERGWRIGQGAEPGYVSAIAAVERIYRTAAGVLSDGEHPEVLEWVLDIVTASWEHDRDGAHQSVIQGLAQLKARFNGGIDPRVLVAKLSQTRPLVILGKAKASRDAAGGILPAHVGRVVAGIYNAGKRTNLLPEWVWTR